MKKLRASSTEREEFLKAIRDELYMGNYGGDLSNFSIENIIKDFSKIPANVVKPRLVINSDAYVKMLELINQSPVECSWHGLVLKGDDRTYIVYDILVFPQRNSGTATTTDEKEFAEWQTKLIMDPEFPIEHLRMHGHSHVMMNVFSSGVDDQYQKDLITKVDDGDYYIFLIMNKKMEMCAFIYDFAQQVMFETADIEIIIAMDCIKFDDGLDFEDIRGWAKNELDQKAITERPQVRQYGYGGHYNVIDEEAYDSYFSKSKPVFSGGRNGSK